MNIHTTDFIELLERVTRQARDYVLYSPSQIARGDHLKNDPTVGERAWNIPETTGRFLYNLIERLGSQSALELGTSVGYSTFWIASALQENNPDAKLITLEKNSEKSHIAQQLLGNYFPFITFHSGIIENYLPLIPEGTLFDFVFMDADRGNYRKYWDNIKKYLHATSIVVIDNAFFDQQSVREFQEYLTSDPTLTTYLHPMDNGLFIVSLSSGPYTNIEQLLT